MKAAGKSPIKSARSLSTKDLGKQQDIAAIFEVTPSKGQLRKFAIVEAAIKCIAEEDFARVNFESIAKRAGVSRPLVKHYFKSMDELFELAANYIRNRFQRLAIEAISLASTAPLKLEAYVESTFDWVDIHHDHAAVWSYFLHRCSLDSKLKKQNTEFAVLGRSRIAALVSLGIKEKAWKCSNCDRAARQIQSLISGALLSYGTDSELHKMLSYRKEMKSACMSFLDS